MVHPVQRARNPAARRHLLRIITVTVVLGALALIACSFSEYAQSEKLAENIDDHRTGCEVDTDALLAGYKQYDANRFYSSYDAERNEPTPTPGPVTDTEIAAVVLLEKVWENGCQTGRRDVVGAEEATLMGLKDQLRILGDRITALEPTPTPTPTPTP